MTKVWCLDLREKYYTDATFTNLNELRGLRFRSGQSLLGKLPARPSVRLLHGSGYSDYVEIGSMDAVSVKIKEVLEEHEASVEFFEISTDIRDDMYMINVTETVGCLDRELSVYKILYSELSVRTLVIRTPEAEPPIYLIRDTILPIVAVRDDLADAIETSGATGVLLKTPEEWTNRAYPSRQ